MQNSIHNLDTKIFQKDGEEFPAIVMGLNVRDLGTIDSFLDHVVERFNVQRMSSPPTTFNMTVTIAGELTAERFADLWRLRYATNPILKAFMSMMVRADVLHISRGALVDRASLVPAKGHPSHN